MKSRSSSSELQPSEEPTSQLIAQCLSPAYNTCETTMELRSSCFAFHIQIHAVFTTLFHIRMCTNCSHCAETNNPCHTALSSSAELMGGLAGRSDGFAAAVECQKCNGSLHLHFSLPNAISADLADAASTSVPTSVGAEKFERDVHFMSR